MALTIKPNENTLIRFEVDVSGSKKTPEPRLRIPISNKGISLVFEGTINKGEVEVDVSELLKLTDSKKFEGILEVVVDDSIFYPWKDQIIIEQSTQVKARNVKTLKESKVSVKVKGANTQIIEKTKPEFKLKKKKLGDMFGEKL